MTENPDTSRPVPGPRPPAQAPAYDAGGEHLFEPIARRSARHADDGWSEPAVPQTGQYPAAQGYDPSQAYYPGVLYQPQAPDPAAAKLDAAMAKVRAATPRGTRDLATLILTLRRWYEACQAGDEQSATELLLSSTYDADTFAALGPMSMFVNEARRASAAVRAGTPFRAQLPGNPDQGASGQPAPPPAAHQSGEPSGQPASGRSVMARLNGILDRAAGGSGNGPSAKPQP